MSARMPQRGQALSVKRLLTYPVEGRSLRTNGRCAPSARHADRRTASRRDQTLEIHAKRSQPLDPSFTVASRQQDSIPVSRTYSNRLFGGTNRMASAPLFKVISDEQRGDHRYLRVEPIAPDSLASDIAPRLTTHYFDEIAARQRLAQAAAELNTFSSEPFVLTEEQIDAALAEERDAVLPKEWLSNVPEQLSAERSEFGEIVGADVLSHLLGSVVPASRIANKEVPDMPTRGADILALEDVERDEVVLLLVEVKGSESATSPPAVVSGMKKKLSQLTTDRRSLLQELIWLRDHSSDEYAALCSRMCSFYLFDKQIFRLMLVPLLVRTATTCNESDSGEFASSPDSFDAPIRWISVVLPDSILDTARKAFRMARDQAS
jgi:hypothetical protein